MEYNDVEKKAEEILEQLKKFNTASVSDNTPKMFLMSYLRAFWHCGYYKGLSLGKNSKK